MRPFTPMVVAASLLVPGASMLIAGNKKEHLVQKEAKKLDGTWMLADFESDGHKQSKEVLDEAKLTIKGDEWTLEFWGAKTHYKVTFDPSRKTKTLDMTLTDEGPTKGKIFRGVYKFVDGDLLVCFAEAPEAHRPRDFSASAGTKQTLYTWKRARP